MLISWITLTISCRAEGRKPSQITSASFTSISADSLPRHVAQLHETFNEADIPGNEYMADRLRPIRRNFKTINSITKWTTIDSVSLEETSEGGVAKYYYQNGQLKKIVARYFGETYQQLNEYYLLKGELSFVFEKSIQYNRPIYYDSTAMRENNDAEVFDIDESEIQEDRSYFEAGKLLHKIESGDCGSPFASDYLLSEEKRIKDDFEKLTKMVATPKQGYR